MKAKIVHAYFAGRCATGLPEGGHSAILEVVQRTPFKQPSTGKVHPGEMLPEEVPVPKFRLRSWPHTLQACEILLKTAEKFPCFEGSKLVKDLPVEEAFQSLIVAAYLAGLLLPSIPYEDSLEVDTLAAVLKAGILQKAGTDPNTPEHCKLILGELKTYINHLTWHEVCFDSLEQSEGNFQVPGQDLTYFDGTPSSTAICS